MLACRAVASPEGGGGNAQPVKILKDPEVREKLVAQGSEPAAGPPEEFGRLLQSEYERLAKVIKTANIKLE